MHKEGKKRDFDGRKYHYLQLDWIQSNLIAKNSTFDRKHIKVMRAFLKSTFRTLCFEHKVEKPALIRGVPKIKQSITGLSGTSPVWLFFSLRLQLFCLVTDISNKTCWWLRDQSYYFIAALPTWSGDVVVFSRRSVLMWETVKSTLYHIISL